MSKEPKLFCSELTDKVYISSAYKIIDEKKGHIVLTGKKYDVTDSFHHICKSLGYKLENENEK
jgi:hypothetical protein